MPNPVFTFRLRPEIKAAAETLCKTFIVEAEELAKDGGMRLVHYFEDGQAKRRWDPNETTNSVMNRLVLIGLREVLKDVVASHQRAVIQCEAWQQVGQFLLANPEATHVEPGDFEPGTPAEKMLTELYEEWTTAYNKEADNSMPYNTYREDAIGELASAERVLKALTKAKEGIEAALGAEGAE
jgi:hypothetical protein